MRVRENTTSGHAEAQGKAHSPGLAEIYAAGAPAAAEAMPAKFS